jgi:antibiotic biosynthesis monooxygenase (ABM) superfamily enzyme
MNLHRYKVRITRPESGGDKFEVLGTLIGFLGMLAFGCSVALSSMSRELVGYATFAIGLTFLIYWFATQFKKIMYFLQFYLVICVVMLSILTYLFMEKCSNETSEYWLARCNENMNVTVLWLIYFVALSLISAIYVRRVWRE